jgi:hypothetical protein
MAPKVRRNPPCQEQVLEGDDVDLGAGCRSSTAGPATPRR